MLIAPDGTGYECTDIATTPDYTPELSTCPISKNQLYSGDWTILVLGNNGDDDSFAYQRVIDLTVGPQQTTTVTPTATYNVTVTPTSYDLTTSTVSTTLTLNATSTVTDAARTRYKTVCPAPTTTTSLHTFTRTYKTWTATHIIVEETITPTCAVPPRQSFPDPICLSLIHI